MVAPDGVLILIAAALAPPAGAALVAEPNLADERLWVAGHAAADRPLRVELVRGSVSIVRRPGAIRIRARTVGGSAHAVSLALVETGRGLLVHDRYAVPASPSWNECLPPTGARGHFWGVDARVHITVEAPASVDVSATVMEQQSGQ